MSNLPLDGVSVVSLTHYLQGPSCVQFLADLGADVVKIERRGGAYERHWSGAQSYVGGRESTFYLAAGRNQRSIELDFRSADGAAILWRLIERADVLVENFRTGVLDRHGFSYEAARRRNPGLVYCSLSGFGPHGPASTRPGQDLLVQSLSGLMMASGQGDGPPVPVGSAVVDQHSATLGAMGVLASLLRRQRTCRGGRVDANLLSAALDLQLESFAYHLNGGLYPRSTTGLASRFHQAPYGVFRTADSWLTISLSDGESLAKAFSDNRFLDLTRDQQFARREEINRWVGDHLATRTTNAWADILDDAGVWNAPVREFDAVEADPQLAVNQSILDYDLPRAGRVRTLNHPVLYDGAAPPLRRLPPAVGEDTTAVLKELGYTAEEIDRFRAADTVGPDRRRTPFDGDAQAEPPSYSRSRT